MLEEPIITPKKNDSMATVAVWAAGIEPQITHESETMKGEQAWHSMITPLFTKS